MARPISRRNTTLSKVSFFTFDKHPAPNNRVNAYDDLSPKPIGESSLVGWDFTKSLGAASGTVNITMKSTKLRGNPLHVGKAWTDLIEEGDWWAIDVVKNGTEQGLSFGRIDQVGVSIQSNMGEGVVGITVQGRDIGFALEDTPIMFNPHDPDYDNVVGIPMLTVIDRAVGRADQVIVNAVTGLMGGRGLQPFSGHTRAPPGLTAGSDPNGTRWVDFIDFDRCVQKNLRGELLAQPMFTPSGGLSIWQYLQAWNNPVMNEMYLDALALPGFPKRACFVLREKPFVNTVDGLKSPWFGLRTHRIDASMVAGMNIAQGPNRKNYVSLAGDMLTGVNEESLKSTFFTHADRDSIDKHGLRRLEEQTRYIDDSKNLGAQVTNREWLNLIINWNALNHRYWQGQITLGELQVKIRPGDRIAIVNGPVAHYPGFPTDLGVVSNALTFYVEGVQHRWQAGARPVAETTLTVTRGFNGDLVRVAEVGKASARFAGIVPVSGSANTADGLNTTTALEDTQIDDSRPSEYTVDSNAGFD